MRPPIRSPPELESLYGSLARLLHCAPEEIALQESATRAWDMAFYSFQFSPGDRIVTAASEYASNYIAFLQVAERTGAQICVVESDASGALDLEALRHLLDDRVKLIALTHVPTNGGLVQPAAEVGKLARQAGIPFLLDALPVGRADPPGCGSAGLRYALSHRAQIPPRPARHRFPLCAPGHPRASAAARRRYAGGGLGGNRQV